MGGLDCFVVTICVCKTAVEIDGDPQPTELIWYNLGVDIGYQYTYLIT